eukprot:scaffold101161_cov62-Phaeocystis_antarctica.AAC.1
MTSVEKPTTDALNVELPGKQGCFQLPRLATIGIHHNGAASYRQHIYASTQCRRCTRCTSSLRLEDDVCETMPTAAAARSVSRLTLAEQKQQQ